MKFTAEIEAAYQRGLEMSRREHGLPSTQVAIEQSPMTEFLEKIAGDGTLPSGATFRAFRKPPEDVVEAYTSEDEAAAFVAGWLDAAGLPGGFRARIED